MVNPFLVAAGVTIAPAMVAMWYYLNRYEEYFDDARVFISLTIGFFAGLVATALELVLFPFGNPNLVEALGPGTAAMLFIVGYASLESLAKAVVLGSRGYRNRKDTPYYGASLGLGFGAMASLQLVALNLRAAETSGNTYQALPFASMVALFMGGVLVHGGAGVWIGRETSEGRLWRGVAMGAAWQAPLLALYWLFWPSIGQGNVVLLVPGLLSVAYGVFLLGWSQSKVLDHVVPPDVRARLMRAKRREARQSNKR